MSVALSASTSNKDLAGFGFPKAWFSLATQAQATYALLFSTNQHITTSAYVACACVASENLA